MQKENIAYKCGGYLTVYLALTMAVLLSLCLTLIEGVRRNTAALETECIVSIGMNSVMAEYHRELFHLYNLFAIDSSYGTNMAGKANTERHLRHYLERNMSMEDVLLGELLYRDFLGLTVAELELTGVSILTDEHGGVFRRRAVEAVKDDVNIELLRELWEWTRVVESKGLEQRDIYGEKQEIDRQIQEYNGKKVQTPEGGTVIVEINNPTLVLEENRSKGILGLITENPETISQRKINLESLISERIELGNVNQGNGNGDKEGKLDRFFFCEYLVRYMGHFGAEKDSSALAYQLEYLIAGKDNDTENLKSVVNRLLLLREAANAMYLFSDSTKCSEAEALAAVIATLLQVPEITDLLKITILLGWAYAESVYDVKTLLAGGRIELIKDEEAWHFGLQGALQTGSITGGTDETRGLSYEDYLRIFIMFTNKETLTGRAMDMVEADIRRTPGNEQFRLDGCLDGIEADILVRSSYGYEYEIVRQKKY